LAAKALQSQLQIECDGAGPDLATAARVLEVLDRVQHGLIRNGRELRRGLRERRLKLPRGLFEALYGGLQIAAEQIVLKPQDKESTYSEFRFLAGLCRELAESEWSEDLQFQVGHFMLHAAAFLVMEESNRSSDTLLERSALLLEELGEEPVPAEMLAYAFHNLGLRVDGLPQHSFIYELIRRIRTACVRERSLTLDEGFAALYAIVGWEKCDPVMRVLWNTASPDFHRWTRVRVEESSSDPCQQATVATRVGFTAFDGTPLAGRGRESDSTLVLTFPGGAGIGRTSVMCRLGAALVLLDFGRDPFGRTAAWFPEVHQLDGVFVSHAHHDHIGGLFRLYFEWGYDGPWYGHCDTAGMACLMLGDSVKIMQEDETGPQYDESHLEKILDRFRPLHPGVPTSIGKGIEITAFDSGHVHGSAQFMLSGTGGRVFYSGDFNTRTNPAAGPLTFPSPEILGAVDALIVEGTNAFRSDGIVGDVDGECALLEYLGMSKRRPVLLPVISLGRTQDVLNILSGSPYRVGVFGLAARVTKHTCLALESNIQYDTRRTADIGIDEYDVLVASAGSLQGGPAAGFLNDSRFSDIPVLLTGYVFPGTPAWSVDYPRVRFSGHAPHDDWLAYVGKFPKASKYLIHFPGPRNVELPAGVTIPRIGKAYRVAD